MSLRIACPHCGVAGSIPSNAAGRRVRCPACSKQFVASAAPPTEQFDFDPIAEPSTPPATSHGCYRPKKSNLGVMIVTIVLGIVGVLGLGAVLYFSGALMPLPPTATQPASAPPPPTLPSAELRPPARGSAPAANSPSANAQIPRPWTGPPPKRDKPLVTVAPVEPVDGIARLGGAPETIGELMFIPASGLGRTIPQVLWNRDGDAFYHLDAAGTLRLIAFPTLKEDKILRTGQVTGRLALGDAGLIVTLPQLEEVWAIDPNTFAIRSRVGLAGVQEALAAPGMNEAIGFCKEGNPVFIEFSGDGGTVREAGIERQALSTLSPDIGGFGLPALSADGKYLFTLGYGEQLVRYRVEGRVLFLEEASARIASGAKKPICISADGKWVAMPCPSGNLKAGEHSTFVFAAGDLSKTAVTLASGPFPQAVAFDAAGDLIYGQNAANALITFDMQGAKKREYPIGGTQAAALVQQMLVHPAGKKMLLITGAGLFVVGPIEVKE